MRILLRDLSNLGATTAALSGGEPLLKPALLMSAVEQAKSHGMRVVITSNGTLLKPRTARTLQQLGVDLLQISVDGSREHHDFIRGSGAYDNAIRGIRIAHENGIRVSMMMVAFRFNHLDLPEQARLAKSLDVGLLGVERFIPAGRGIEIERQALASQDLQRLHRAIADVQEEFSIELHCNDPTFSAFRCSSLGMQVGNVGTVLGGCSAGIDSCYINSEGMVLPCTFSNLQLGNVRTCSLEEIWRCSPILRRLRNRDLLEGQCRRCAHISVCGGCRAVTGDGYRRPVIPDPACYLFKQCDAIGANSEGSPGMYGALRARRQRG